MKHKPEEDKKNKQPEIREGREDNTIHHQKKAPANNKSYPLPSRQDEQYKNQTEFIDDEPNKTTSEE